MAFSTELCVTHLHFVSIDVILEKTYQDHMFFDGPFYKQINPTSSLLLEKKRCLLIGTHTHLPNVKEGIKQAIMAAEFNMEALQCYGQVASSSDLRPKTYTTFRRNIFVCKTTLPTRKVIRTFEKRAQ